MVALSHPFGDKSRRHPQSRSVCAAAGEAQKEKTMSTRIVSLCNFFKFNWRSIAAKTLLRFFT